MRGVRRGASCEPECCDCGQLGLRGRGQGDDMNTILVGRGELGLLRRWGKEAGRACLLKGV
jgi:hypothetical protein